MLKKKTGLFIALAVISLGLFACSPAEYDTSYFVGTWIKGAEAALSSGETAKLYIFSSDGTGKYSSDTVSLGTYEFSTTNDITWSANADTKMVTITVSYAQEYYYEFRREGQTLNMRNSPHVDWESFQKQ